MGNCLVTKLKETVSNVDANYLGAFKLTLSANSVLVLAMYGNEEAVPVPHLIINGDGYFSDSSFSENYGKELEDNDSTTLYIKVNSTCNVFVFDEYKLVYLRGNNNGSIENVEIDLSPLEYREYLKDIRFKSTGVYGELSNISNSIEDVRITFSSVAISASVFSNKGELKNVFANGDANFTGNITFFSASPKLTSLALVDTNTYGRLESLLENLLLNGKSTPLSIQPSEQITFNGQGITGLIDITYGDSSITVASSGVTLGTYDGSTWTYNS